MILYGIFENPIAQEIVFGTNANELAVKANCIGLISIYLFSFMFSTEQCAVGIFIWKSLKWHMLNCGAELSADNVYLSVKMPL